MDVDEFEQQALKASNLLKAMSNESRLMILCQLVHGEKTVGELEHVVHLSQSALSQHLAVLRQNDLVKTRRAAQSIFYSLAGPEARALIETLHRLYADPEGQCATGQPSDADQAADDGGK